MAEKVFRATNGVSFGANYKIVADDATAGEITFVFKGSGDLPVDYPLVANILVTREGVNVPLGNSKITYPENGKVKVVNGSGGGSNFVLTVDDIISIIAQRADGVVIGD